MTDGSIDRPCSLEFNQPVRPEDVLAHTSVRYQAHDFDEPVISAAARRRMAQGDATALSRFDGKVASAREASRRDGAVSVRLTNEWDRERFPPRDSLVMLQTVAAPAAGTWLAVTLDPQITGVQGTARPVQAQTSTVELAPVFFARTAACTEACNPSCKRHQSLRAGKRRQVRVRIDGAGHYESSARSPRAAQEHRARDCPRR